MFFLHASLFFGTLSFTSSTFFFSGKFPKFNYFIFPERRLKDFKNPNVSNLVDMVFSQAS